MRRFAFTLGCTLASLLLGAPVAAAKARPPARACPVTLPSRTVSADAGLSAGAFNYGNGPVRTNLYWPDGTIRAGSLPDGGSMATVGEGGSIHLKLGWWRGTAGRLRIAGRRLDAPALPLVAHVPSGYGRRGFQPSGLVFPTPGCWEVVGAVVDARLRFVVRVTKLRWL